MKKWKKIFCLLLATIMVFSVTTAATSVDVSAAKTSPIKKGKTFTLEGMKYKITKVSGKKGAVTLVGPISKKLKKVELTDTIKIQGYKFTLDAIAANAFKNCTQLKTIKTNPALKTIGKGAFYGCKKLEEIKITGKNLKTIGSSAFAHCTKLETLSISSEKLAKVGKNALKGVSENISITLPENKSLEYDAMLRGKEAPRTQAQESADAREMEQDGSHVIETVKEPSVSETKNSGTDTAALPSQNTNVSTSDQNTTDTSSDKQENANTSQTAPQEQTKAEEKATATKTPEAQAAKKPMEASKAPQTPAAPTEATDVPPATEQPAAAQPETDMTQPEEPMEHPEDADHTNTESSAKSACSKGNHVFSKDWVVKSEPTCVSSGSKTRRCDCGQVASSTSYGAPTGKHAYVSRATAATCIAAGSSYEECTMCGHKINVTSTPAKGHTYKTVEISADCTKGGFRYDECTTCGHQTNKTATPVASHKWVTKTELPTCTISGCKKEVCEICGKIGKLTDYEPAAHTFVCVETVKGNCTKDSYKVKKCTKCSYTETEVTEKAYGHTLVRSADSIPATCQKEGTINLHCTECDYTAQKIEPKTDHRWILNENRQGLKECYDCHVLHKQD